MGSHDTRSQQDLLNAMVLRMAELCIAHSDRAMTSALRPLLDAYKLALAVEQDEQRRQHRQHIANCGTSRHFSLENDHAGHD